MATEAMDSVAAKIKACMRCDLCHTRTNAVPGEGPPTAKVFIVGEAPGRNEDAQGIPFVGAAGQNLNRLLDLAGLERNDVFITNIVKCRPPNNRRPTDEEVSTCAPYIERQLKLMKPALVIALGATAVGYFLPSEQLNVIHGKVTSRRGLKIYPTYHPAATIYNPSLKPIIEADFRALKSIL